MSPYQKLHDWADDPALTNKQQRSRLEYVRFIGVLLRFFIGGIIVSIGFVVGSLAIFLLLFLMMNFPVELAWVTLGLMFVYFIGWTAWLFSFKPKPTSIKDDDE